MHLCWPLSASTRHVGVCPTGCTDSGRKNGVSALVCALRHVRVSPRGVGVWVWECGNLGGVCVCPRWPGHGAAGTAISPEAGAPQGGAPGRILVQQQHRMMSRSRSTISNGAARRGSFRGPKHDQEDEQRAQQEDWSKKKGPKGSSKKPKGKQDVWKDVPAHEQNVHKVGAVGQRLPEDSVPLPEWPERLATWPTKEQDDEATHFIDLVSVKDMEWAIQHSDSNGGFEQCAKGSSSIAEDMEEDNLGVGLCQCT